MICDDGDVMLGCDGVRVWMYLKCYFLPATRFAIMILAGAAVLGVYVWTVNI